MSRQDPPVQHVLLCEKIAEALIVGFTKCELEGRPLSELQRIDMVATAVQAGDRLSDELQEFADADWALRRWAADQMGEAAE